MKVNAGVVSGSGGVHYNAGQLGKILVDDVEEPPGRENGAEYLEGPKVHAAKKLCMRSYSNATGRAREGVDWEKRIRTVRL